MDLSAELDELSHGLRRQRRLLELALNRLHLAASLLDSRALPPSAVSLDEVQRVTDHLRHEEQFRADLVAGIASEMGTSAEPDLPELIANVPRPVADRLSERRARLVGVISAVDALAVRLREDSQQLVGAPSPLPAGPTSPAGSLARTASSLVQPSLRRFVHPDD